MLHPLILDNILMYSTVLSFVPDFQQSFVHMDAFPIDQELQVWNLWAVELLLQGLSDSQVVVSVWQEWEKEKPFVLKKDVVNKCDMTPLSETVKLSHCQSLFYYTSPPYFTTVTTHPWMSYTVYYLTKILNYS